MGGYSCLERIVDGLSDEVTSMFQIRPYKREDAKDVQKCFTELQRFENDIEPSRTDGRVVGKTYVLQMLKVCKEKNGRVFIAEDRGKVVGYAFARIERHPERIFTTITEYVYVQDLVLLPHARKKGIGKKLLQEVEKYAKGSGMRTILLTVLAKNPSAKKFYGKSGFTELDIVMRKKL